MNTSAVRHRRQLTAMRNGVNTIIRDLAASAPALPENERKALNLLRCASASMKHAEQELGDSA